MPRLIAIDGPLVGRRYEIDRELVLDGSDAEVVLGSEAAGAAVGDAVIRQVGADQLSVEGAGSGDGVWVDGSRVDEPVILRDGTRVKVGGTTFIVEIDAWTSSPAERSSDRSRTQPMLAAIALPALGDVDRSEPRAPYAAPSVAHRRRADTRMWLPAAATFAAIILTAVALMVYFALR